MPLRKLHVRPQLRFTDRFVGPGMFPPLAKHLVDAVHAISAFQSTLAYI